MEAVFKNFNISYNQTIQVTYAPIDIYSIPNCYHSKWCNSVETFIPYNHQTYKVNISKNNLIIYKVGVDNLIVNHILKLFDITPISIISVMVQAFATLKTRHPIRFASSSPQCIINEYIYWYIRSDLKIALTLLFKHKNSWFYTLPIELCQVILQHIE